MFVVCVVLSCTGLCDKMITRPRGVIPTVACPCVTRWPNNNGQSCWATPVTKIDAGQNKITS
jgi:hypothetical protein